MEKTEFAASPETLDKIAGELPYLQSWISSVMAMIQAALESGMELKNAYLVEKTTFRKWALPFDECVASIQAVLIEAGKPADLDIVAPRQIVTPAGAEKLVGKKRFATSLNEHVYRPPTEGYNLRLRSANAQEELEK